MANVKPIVKRLIALVVVLAIAGAGTWAYLYAQGRSSAARFRTTTVERGPLTATVSASGTLNAVITVQVGSQVSGQIKALYADFNSQVRKGQLVARIDPEMFDAKVKQAQGDLDAARATVLNQQAAVAKAEADLQNARAAVVQGRAQTAKAKVAVADGKRNLGRISELRRRDLVAQSDEDTAQVTYDSALAQLDANVAQEQALSAAASSAEAQLRVTRAQLEAAQAQVKQKEAALKQAQVDLDHTRIEAPVDGVVVSRNVDVGQTVAASLQAPTLFLIAQDLTRMQVDTNVDEADVGRVRLGQAAPFTVDAFPGRTFTGEVTQIRKAPQVVQNVVTYDVVVEAPNRDQKLLPGMTANVKITVEQKQDVLKVANAALRYRPVGDSSPAPGARGGGGTAQRGPSGAPGGAAPSPERTRERLVTSLKLTDAQQKKLDPILEDARQQFRALASAPEQERQARAQKIREAARARIREILTPEQQARYDADAAVRSGGPRGASGAPAGQPGRVWIAGPDGAPRAVDVVLGLSDGTSTEILGGDLKEGQEVIVGSASKNAPAAPGGGPRLRL